MKEINAFIRFNNYLIILIIGLIIVRRQNAIFDLVFKRGWLIFKYSTVQQLLNV